MEPRQRPVVHVREGATFADSRDVASFFDKEHRTVLDDVRRLLSDHSAGNHAVWFRSASYDQKVGFGSRKNPCFEMTKDGFALLVMGFTGPKALGFKVRYIEEFNRMERQLQEAQTTAPTINLSTIEAQLAQLTQLIHTLQPATAGPAPVA